MSAHTPGPWTVPNTKAQSVCNSKVNCSAGYCVAQSYSTPSWNVPYVQAWAEAEANARLIATAPELLEALRAVVGELNYVHKTGDVRGSIRNSEAALEMASSALAKAEGCQS